MRLALKALTLFSVFLAAVVGNSAHATVACSVTAYDTEKFVSIDDEFASGVQDITHCLEKSNAAKVVVAVDYTHPYDAVGNVQTNKATFLSNIDKMVRNYEVVNGMEVGKDVEIVVVFNGSSAALATTQHPMFARSNAGDPANPFRHLVEYGIEQGFTFYVCRSAARALGINMENKIPEVNFVPGGHITVADFQMRGYALIRP